jgi:hypothetical protein
MALSSTYALEPEGEIKLRITQIKRRDVVVPPGAPVDAA